MENCKPLAIILTDTHLTKDNIEQNKSIFQQAIDLCHELGINKIFHAGDIFTSRTGQSLEVLKAWDEVVHMFESNKITCYAIKGNHDATDLTSSQSFLDIFEKKGIFEVTKTWSKIEFKSGQVFYFLPYFKEGEVYQKYLIEIIEDINPDYDNHLITHIAVNGVCNNDGTKVNHGIPTEMFEGFMNVFTGHYHSKSEVGDNIHYIGSAFPHNFGEDNNKGFTILYDDNSFEYTIATFPQYLKVEIDVDDLSNKKKVQQYLNYAQPEIDNGHNVRFIFTGTAEKLKTVDKELFESKGIEIKILSDELIGNMEIASNNEAVQYNSENIKVAFGEFCEKNEIVEENLAIGESYINQL